MRSRTTSTPAAPIATSVVAARQGRPKESVTMTPTSAPVRSRSSSRRRDAEESGSTGRSTTGSGAGARPGDSLAGAPGTPRRDVLDEDQRRIVLVPETVQLLERDEAERLVERTGRAVAAARPRRAERLHVEIADAVHPAPRLGRGD